MRKVKSYWSTWSDTWSWSSVYVHPSATFQSWLILFWAWVVLNNPDHLGKWAGTVAKAYKAAVGPF